MAKHAGRCSRSPGWSRAGTGDHILDFVKSILYHRFSRVLLHQGLACPGALVALQEALLVLDPLFLVLEDQLLMVDLFLDLSTVGCQVLSCILSKIYNLVLKYEKGGGMGAHGGFGGPGGPQQSLQGPLAYLERTTSNIGGSMGAMGPGGGMGMMNR